MPTTSVPAADDEAQRRSDWCPLLRVPPHRDPAGSTGRGDDELVPSSAAPAEAEGLPLLPHLLSLAAASNPPPQPPPDPRDPSRARGGGGAGAGSARPRGAAAAQQGALPPRRRPAPEGGPQRRAGRGAGPGARRGRGGPGSTGYGDAGDPEAVRERRGEALPSRPARSSAGREREAAARAVPSQAARARRRQRGG